MTEGVPESALLAINRISSLDQGELYFRQVIVSLNSFIFIFEELPFRGIIAWRAATVLHHLCMRWKRNEIKRAPSALHQNKR